MNQNNNPFDKIPKDSQLIGDNNSEFFGRFRLKFEQVYPFREPSFGRVFIKLKKEVLESAKLIYSSFPEDLQYKIALFQQSEIKTNKFVQINFFEDDEWFLCLDILSDVCYISMYNFYFALLNLSKCLEDCHFYIYSSGDLDTRWIDEYKVNDGELIFSRNNIETESYWGVLIYYLKAAQKTTSHEFKKFVAYRIYTKFYPNQEVNYIENGKEYNDYGEEITYDITAEMETMSEDELCDMQKGLKTLFNLDLDNNLGKGINALYNFDDLYKSL